MPVRFDLLGLRLLWAQFQYFLRLTKNLNLSFLNLILHVECVLSQVKNDSEICGFSTIQTVSITEKSAIFQAVLQKLNSGHSWLAITWLFFEFLALKFRTSMRNVCSTWPWLRIVSITWLGNELLKRFALQLLVVGSQFFYLTFDDLPVKVNFKSFRFQNSWNIHFQSISVGNFQRFVEILNWQLLIGSQNRWLDPINLTMIRLN